VENSQFTPRQLDVIVEMCKGKPNKEIARALGMAEATVKLHLTEIFRTLGVRNRSQAIIKASNLPITKADPPKPLTDTEILKTFTNTAFDSLNDQWSDRVLKFSRALFQKNL